MAQIKQNILDTATESIESCKVWAETGPNYRVWYTEEVKEQKDKRVFTYKLSQKITSWKKDVPLGTTAAATYVALLNRISNKGTHTLSLPHTSKEMI